MLYGLKPYCHRQKDSCIKGSNLLDISKLMCKHIEILLALTSLFKEIRDISCMIRSCVFSLCCVV